jgi:hypothetical protein
MDEDHGALVV